MSSADDSVAGAHPPEPTSGARNRSRAVFLDRDGVLNRNLFHADTQAFESPRTPEDLELAPHAGAALTALRAAGYRLILVSNQPNAAKGKCSRATLDRIHERLVESLATEHVTLDRAFYCYHHPAYTGTCACRKPLPFFLLAAAAEYGLDLEACWMIGDRASDIECGRAAGARTIWIDNQEGQSARADRRASCLLEAASYILDPRLIASGQRG